MNNENLDNKKKKVVVLGAGVGGLSAGYFLAKTGKYEVTVLEKERVIGGLCSSFEHDGFVLDYGAHKLYSVIPGILDDIYCLMKERLIKLPKRNRLFLCGHLVDYPLRLSSLAQALGMATSVRLGFGYAITFLKRFFDKKEARSYEDYVVKRFGRPAYELVFEPLADKVWGNPSVLHSDMARTRIPASGGIEVILKLLGIKKDTSETNAEYFYYPSRGFGDFPNVLKEHIESMEGKVIVGIEIKKIEQVNKKITSVNGTLGGQSVSFACDYLVSSIHLPVISRLLFSETDNEFDQAINRLQFRHLILVYIFIKRPQVLDDQWIFFPESDLIFSRIFEQKQMNPELCPTDKTVICCDFTFSDDDWMSRATDVELASKCVKGLVDCGFIKSDEVASYLVKRVYNFYPRYDLEYNEKLKVVIDKIRQVENILLTGRIGMYNYNNADHCYDMGKFISNKLLEGISPVQLIEELERRMRNYKIVD